MGHLSNANLPTTDVEIDEVYAHLRDHYGWGYGDHQLTDPRAAIRAVAAAIGAVNELGETDRVPYRYFITYTVFSAGWRGWLTAGAQIAGSRWFDLERDIEGPDDTRQLARQIAAEHAYPVIVTITGLTYIDGPV